MKTRFIPAIVTLIAAAVVSIANIIKQTELKSGLITLLIVIMIFYILGVIAKVIVEKTIKAKEEETKEVEEENEQEEDQEQENAEADATGTNDKVDE